MPYNSQSRLIQELNRLFSYPELPGLKLHNRLKEKQNGQPSYSLTDRADWNFTHRINTFERQHIDAWPQDQQEFLRGQLIVAIGDELPTSFAWEEGPVYRTVLVSWGTAPGITFRSPFYTTELT
jgi:hypothetical protein